jgi:hypothetical protein
MQILKGTTFILFCGKLTKNMNIKDITDFNDIK